MTKYIITRGNNNKIVKMIVVLKEKKRKIIKFQSLS